MIICFCCPHCQTKIKATEYMAGTSNICPECKRRLPVPEKEE